MVFRKWGAFALCLGFCLQASIGQAVRSHQDEEEGSSLRYTQLNQTSEQQPTSCWYPFVKNILKGGFKWITCFSAAYAAISLALDQQMQCRPVSNSLVSIPEDSSYSFPPFQNTSLPEDDGDFFEFVLNECSVNAHYKGNQDETNDETTIRIMSLVLWDFYTKASRSFSAQGLEKIKTVYCACTRAFLSEGKSQFYIWLACRTFLELALNGTRLLSSDTPSLETDDGMGDAPPSGKEMSWEDILGVALG